MKKSSLLHINDEQISSSSADEEPPPRQLYSEAFHVSQRSMVINLKKKNQNRFPISAKTNLFRKRFFPNASKEEWNDWHWQLANRININSLYDIFVLSEEEKKALAHSPTMPLKITPYYASLIERENPNHAIRQCVIPRFAEFIHSPEEALDPLNEDTSSPVEGIVHRYPDRVLFIVTDFCSTNCRYCTRSRVVGQGHGNYHFETSNWEKGIEYIKANKVIRDVLISGGDPLTLPDEKIEWLLKQVRAIPHVEIIRIGTKVPIVLPQRVTAKLARMLKKYHPLWISVHCTHAEEFTPESGKAFERLANAGIPLGSQTVLLKGINDNVPAMKALMHKLLINRVKPYYIYQCDPILGSSHFRTPVEKGIEIIEGLRGHTTGYAVPQYVIDAPGGGGKIPILPDYYQGQKDGQVILRNYQRNTYFYPNKK